VVPLATQLAEEGLLVGVGHHVSPQVLLVLGGEAAAGALVRPQVRVQRHVFLVAVKTTTMLIEKAFGCS